MEESLRCLVSRKRVEVFIGQGMCDEHIQKSPDRDSGVSGGPEAREPAADGERGRGGAARASVRTPVSWTRWIRWGAFFVAIVPPFLMFHHDAIRRVLRAARDPDWSHLAVVPLVSLWLLYRDRERLRETLPRPWPWGGALLVAGMGGYLLALYPIRNEMLEMLALVWNVWALVLTLAGPEVVRRAWFPLAYLLFMVRISNKVWGYFSWKLQMTAAKCAAALLVVMGVDVRIRGDIIEVWHGLSMIARLNVAEACSGLRMIMALAALGALLAGLRRGAWWKRLLLFLSTVPIAVAVNAGRVAIAGVLAWFRLPAGPGVSHTLVGLIMMVPAVALFFVVGRLLDLVFPEHETRELNKEPVQADDRFSAEEGKREAGRDFAKPSSGPRLRIAVPIASACVLWGGAIGMDVLLQRLHVVFERAALPLRRPLAAIPSRLGPYALEKEFPRLSREAEGALRAEQYITRLYRRVGDDGEAGPEVRVHVAYFSGTPDTVIHVPEICYVAGGVRNAWYEQGSIPLPRAAGPASDRESNPVSSPACERATRLPQEIPVRVLHFLPPDAPDGATEESVMYFFIANGRFFGMPEGVRALVLDLRLRAVYWCKVEVWAPGLPWQESRRVCGDFLSHLLPELFRCLPDVSQTGRRRTETE